MIINRLLFVGFLFLILTTSCNQKFYKTDKVFLEEGELIMKDFFLAFGDTVRAERVRLSFDPRMGVGKKAIFQRQKGSTNHKKDHYLIRPFGTLLSSDTIFLEKIIKLEKLNETPKSLYYKLGTNWLLPHIRAWRIGLNVGDLLDENSQPIMRLTDKRFDKAVLYFLAKSERLEAFPKFGNIIQFINKEMRKEMGEEWFENVGERKVYCQSFKEYLYYRAGTMLITIEELK